MLFQYSDSASCSFLRCGASVASMICSQGTQHELLRYVVTRKHDGNFHHCAADGVSMMRAILTLVAVIVLSVPGMARADYAATWGCESASQAACLTYSGCGGTYMTAGSSACFSNSCGVIWSVAGCGYSCPSGGTLSGGTCVIAAVTSCAAAGLPAPCAPTNCAALSGTTVTVAMESPGGTAAGSAVNMANGCKLQIVSGNTCIWSDGDTSACWRGTYAYTGEAASPGALLAGGATGTAAALSAPDSTTTTTTGGTSGGSSTGTTTTTNTTNTSSTVTTSTSGTVTHATTNNTNVQVTNEMDSSGIIAAVNAASSAISGAVNTTATALGVKVDAVKEAITDDSCAENPTRAGCAELGTDTGTVGKATRGLTMIPGTYSETGGCPAPRTFEAGGHNFTVTYSEVCSAATDYVKPLVLLAAAVGAYLIFVGGLRT